MNRVQQLIDELCPNGVEFKELREVIKYEQPQKYLVSSTDYSNNFATPVLTAGQTFILGYTNETTGIYNASVNRPVIIFDDFTTDFKWVDFPFKAKSSAMKMLTAKNEKIVDTRYIYFAMSGIKYKPQDHARQWISKYATFRIPVPPLEVQREIVAILDTFTQLDAALKAELDIRIKQRDYYRDKLLSFEGRNDVDFKRLGDVANFVKGVGIRKSELKSSGVPAIHYGELYSHYGSYTTKSISYIDPAVTAVKTFASTRDLIVGLTNWSLDNVCKAVAWLGNFPVAVGSDAVVVKHSYNPKFLAHYFQSNEFLTKARVFANGSTVIHYSVKNLGNLEIPNVQMEVQNKIAQALDTFDDLIYNIEREIEIRQKQFEYYRNLLLTFKAAN